MYRAFNIKTEASAWAKIKISDDVQNKSKTHAKQIASILENLTQSMPIDGAKLRDRWFPKIKADVFISHSHNDEELALKCATWLKNEFQLEAFVDSCVWGSADNLLFLIDKQYCYNEDKETFSYEKRNETTSHIHMMLATALSEMLDFTESIFFINTPNSIVPDEVISKTKSPWLFYELAAIQTLRRKKPDRTGALYEFPEILKKAGEKLNIEYTVSLHALTKLTTDDLIAWQDSEPNEKDMHPLDWLYENHPE